MDIISWFWHPMALYILVLGGAVLVPVVGVVVVFAIILRGKGKPSTLPPMPGEEPATPQPGLGSPQPYGYPPAPAAAPAPLTPGQLPGAAPAGGHIIPPPAAQYAPRDPQA